MGTAPQNDQDLDHKSVFSHPFLLEIRRKMSFLVVEKVYCLGKVVRQGTMFATLCFFLRKDTLLAV